MEAVDIHSELTMDTLDKMLSIRRFIEPWLFLMKSEPRFDVQQLVAGTQYSISGSMKTKSRMLPQREPKPSLWERDELDSASDFELTTNWYFVPHFCFDQVSVGAVVGENTDANHILFQDAVTFRYTRYARDDVTGDFFVLMVDPGEENVEILYIKPNSNTDRLRAFIRFDYMQFMDVCHSSTPEVIDLHRLREAIKASNIVKEYRLCPTCKTFPGTCTCQLSLRRPTRFMDLACNASNMSAHVGNFVGTSFHYVRGGGPMELTEQLTQCDLQGGPLTPETSRLYSWAIQNRLSECPINPSLPPGQPRFQIEPPSPVHSGDSVEYIASFDDATSHTIENSLDIPSAGNPVVHPALIATDLCSNSTDFSNEVPVTESIASQLPIGVALGAQSCLPLADRFVTNAGSGEVTFQRAALRPVPGPILNTAVESMAMAPSPTVFRPRVTIEKSSPTRRPGRGRRKKQPIVRPLHPVVIAPLPGQTGMQSAVPQEQWEVEGFTSKEEWQKFQKVLKSRESAARSNQKRKMRALEKRKQLQQSHQV